MPPLHDHQTTIIRSARVQVDQTLQTPKPREFRVLVLMRPTFVRGGVTTVWPLDVDNVEGTDDVFGVVNAMGKVMLMMAMV